MKRIAINGLGRIGKLVFQYLLESDAYKNGEFEIVGINDLTNISQLAYLLKYDSTQRSMQEKGHKIEYATDINDSRLANGCVGYLKIDDKLYPVFAQPDPTKLPWGELNVDIVCECTGRFATVEGASQHLTAGAKHVIVNAPVKGVKNIVYKVNSDSLDGTEDIICGASCTTNCLAPLARILNLYGIEKGMMTTVHSYTADQSILDCPHKKGENSRRGRCAGNNIVPASTGAAEAVAKALPELKGRLTGMAMRVPTATGSVVVFDVLLRTGYLSAEEINKTIKNFMDNESISGTDDPVVSSDIIGCEYGSYVDFQSTKVLESDGKTTMAQVVSWYDNEASYTHQFVKTLLYWTSKM